MSGIEGEFACCHCNDYVIAYRSQDMKTGMAQYICPNCWKLIASRMEPRPANWSSNTLNNR